MRYIISDIHGCYEEYMELLDKIHFCSKDELYVLGDAMDRGPEPIKVIQDLMARGNVTYIVGNHDHMMLSTLKRLAVEITEENCESYLSPDDLLNYHYWIQAGGGTTAGQFGRLSREEQWDILDYLGDALLYEVLEDQGEEFILVHAGLQRFKENKDLELYDLMDLIYGHADYSRRYYQDHRKYLVTGHTPTMTIREDKKPFIYQEHGHIAIDCGAVFGGNLAAYCLETREAVYVPGRQEKMF